MDEIQTNDKSCANCRYFSQHYVKRSLTLIQTDCGTCWRSSIRTDKKQRITLCDFWEYNDVDVEEKKQRVKNTLMDISKRLDDLTIILKNYFEN